MSCHRLNKALQSCVKDYSEDIDVDHRQIDPQLELGLSGGAACGLISHRVSHGPQPRSLLACLEDVPIALNQFFGLESGGP